MRSLTLVGMSEAYYNFGLVRLTPLRTQKEMAAYLEACMEEADGDAAFIAKALGDIARAKGMTQVAPDAGLSRQSLYKALSGERSPGFDTILKVVKRWD